MKKLFFVMTALNEKRTSLFQPCMKRQPSNNSIFTFGRCNGISSSKAFVDEIKRTDHLYKHHDILKFSST
jgi:hypothetical protein